MNTPIADFVKKYAESNVARFHMPGHKGQDFLGIEKYDITEIDGADVLSQADGIIAESENNTSSLFGTSHTFYSAGGSTVAIYAMLSLVKGKDTLILAARNVHKSFVNACALLDYDVEWILSDGVSSLLRCEINADTVEKSILAAPRKPAAVYLTSPDYLGNIQNIPEISAVCKKYEIPLLADNAHGAYLAFLEKSMHPIHLGATVCCDSAHKTLPVLTGGAYLHIAKDAPEKFLNNARGAIELFSSTSPSYLILQSLDLCNKYLDECAKTEFKSCAEKINSVKEYISEKGFYVSESEPLKIVIDAKKSGYTGKDLAEALRKCGGEPEFYDEDYIVLMLSPQNTQNDFDLIIKMFSETEPKTALPQKCISVKSPLKKMTIREAVFAQKEAVDVKSSVGRICGALTVSCPPAIPIAISGEEITEEIAELFLYYGINSIYVIKNF